MKSPVKIGVLALQGAFIEHIRLLQSLGVETFEIRKKTDLQQPFDGLIFPGGESTVIGKLLHELDLFKDLKAKIEKGTPVFGTCAGMILLAKQIHGENSAYFKAIDIIVKRNAYGRQLGSFCTESEFKGIGNIPMTFIRAPYILEAGQNTEILSKVDGRIVAAREKNVLVTSYHPELTGDRSVHQYFLKMIENTSAEFTD